MPETVTCHRCEHTWEYSGTMQKATCPSCGYKTRVDDQEAAVADGGESA